MENFPSPMSPSVQPGEPYCGHCGYPLKGLTDSSRCPECGKPIVDVLMRRGSLGRLGKRYRSKASLFGLPVIDIALGPSGSERIGRAKGIVAVGDFAVGWLAIGGIARGIVAIGGLAVGIFSIGGGAVGLFTAEGGMAASLGFANGGMSLGTIANGGVAVGIIAQGGVAIGRSSRGGLSTGHSNLISHFDWLLGRFPSAAIGVVPLLFALVPPLLFGALIYLVAMTRHERDDPDTSPPRDLK